MPELDTIPDLIVPTPAAAVAETPAPPPQNPAHFVVPGNVAQLALLTSREDHPRLAGMNCVRLTVDPEGHYSATATDGRILGVLHGQAEKPITSAWRAPADARPSDSEALVPGRMLRAVTRSARRHYSSRLRLRLSSAGEPCQIDVNDRGHTDSWKAEPSSGRFPDVDAVMPKGEPVAKIRVDPAYLARLLAVCRDLSPDPTSVVLEIRSGESTPLVVRGKGYGRGQEFVGLVTPMT